MCPRVKSVQFSPVVDRILRRTLPVNWGRAFLRRYSPVFSETKIGCLAQVYLLIGNCFAIVAGALREGSTFYPYRVLPRVLETPQGLEIDSVENLSFAQVICASEKFDLS